jgi:hypothetical protein
MGNDTNVLPANLISWALAKILEKAPKLSQLTFAQGTGTVRAYHLSGSPKVQYIGTDDVTNVNGLLFDFINWSDH